MHRRQCGKFRVAGFKLGSKIQYNGHDDQLIRSKTEQFQIMSYAKPLVDHLAQYCQHWFTGCLNFQVRMFPPLSGYSRDWFLNMIWGLEATHANNFVASSRYGYGDINLSMLMINCTSYNWVIVLITILDRLQSW